jgi:hypothetical protein
MSSTSKNQLLLSYAMNLIETLILMHNKSARDYSLNMQSKLPTNEAYLTKSLAFESDKIDTQTLSSHHINSEALSRWNNESLDRFLVLSFTNLKKQSATRRPAAPPRVKSLHSSAALKSQSIRSRKLSRNIQSSDIDTIQLQKILTINRNKRHYFNSPSSRMQMQLKNKEKVRKRQISKLATMLKQQTNQQTYILDNGTLNVQSISLHKEPLSSRQGTLIRRNFINNKS